MKLRFLTFAAATVAACLSVVPLAHATIVERIVAVVGERPVLWTDLLHRASSLRVEIRLRLLEQYLKTHPESSLQTVDMNSAIDPNVISLQEQEMYKELLDRVIDDRLEEQQAERAHITITPEEIDRGLANIASNIQAQQGRPVSVQDVIGEEHRRGLSEQDFRDEVRRQVLEGKLIELRVRPRVRVTEQDARASYQHWLQELKDQEPVDVRVLPLRVLPGSTPQQIDERMALADDIVKRARAGTDFCQLVQQYSDDVTTRPSCGSRGAQPMSLLLPPIQAAVRSLKAGAISDPIPVNVGTDQAVVILQPLGSARIPPYDDVKNEMSQRAFYDGLDRAKKQWLQELRHNIYIDVRL